MSPATGDARAFVPATDAQLEEALEHARLVEELGLIGAPGAAYSIAMLAPAIVLEVREARKALERACCSGCGTVLESRAAAAEHVLVCEQHPIGKRVWDLVDELTGEVLAALDAARKSNKALGRARELLEWERETSRQFAAVCESYRSTVAALDMEIARLKALLAERAPAQAVG